MKYLILEDDKKSSNHLKEMISLAFPDFQCIGQLDTIEEFIDSISKVEPDFVCLDIQLKQELSLRIFELLPTFNIPFIFTTGFEKYAIQAFRLSAADYLLKPIKKNELIDAVNKLSNQITRNNWLQKQKVITSNINSNEKKLFIKIKDNYEVVEIDRIVRLYAQGMYSQIYTEDNLSFITAKPLKHFEILLSDLGFIRISRAEIINSSYISKVINKSNSELILQNKYKAVISSRRKTYVLKEIEKLIQSN